MGLTPSEVIVEEKVKDLINTKKDTYDKELDEVKQNIGDIIKSIELGNVIKGKCGYCP